MIDAGFLEDFRKLMTGESQTHMSPHMYADHAGARGGKSMSGARLWEKLANEEPTYPIARADVALLGAHVEGLAALLPAGMTLVDLGPGAPESVLSKSMRLAKALDIETYQPVDGSPAFAQGAAKIAQDLFPHLSVKPTIADIFSKGFDAPDNTLVYFGGGTLSNLVHPVSKIFPRRLLAQTMKNLTHHARSGWLLLSLDTMTNGDGIRKVYGSDVCHDFIGNVMYRAASELPLEGFNPDLFAATPLWVAESYQMAAIVTATHAQRFRLKGQEIQVEKGQLFPIVNSYKYPTALFEDVAREIGLSVAYRAVDPSGLALYLLRGETVRRAGPSERARLAA